MVAAIYARKSTDRNGVADEERSVTRQVEHARAFAARKGWTVDQPHVYVGDGISGAESANRPRFFRLMNAIATGVPKGKQSSATSSPISNGSSMPTMGPTRWWRWW